MIKTANIKLYWIFLLSFLYAIFDAVTSASSGNRDSDRSNVYIFLILLVVSLMFFVFLKLVIKLTPLLNAQIVFSLYFFINYYLIKGSSGWNNFVLLGLTVWWIFTLLYFENVLNETTDNFATIRKFARFMFVFYTIVIIYGANNFSNNYKVEIGRVGYIYHIMALLPILLLEQNRKLKTLFVLATIVLAFISFKRGSIVILPVMLAVYYYFDNRTRSSKSFLLRLVLLFIILAIAWFMFDHYTDGALSSRFTAEELADGSGRSDIYSTIITNVSKRDFIQLLFGIPNVAETTLNVGAHNEWLGRLDKMGLVGLIIFAVVFWRMVKPGFTLVKKKSVLAPSYVAMIVFIIGVSLFSGLYFVHSSFYLMIYIAVVNNISKYDEKKIIEIIS